MAKASTPKFIRAEYASLRARMAVGSYAGGYDPATLNRDLRAATIALANQLGHTPLIQGSSCECYRCGMTGGAHDELVGDVFTKRCAP